MPYLRILAVLIIVCAVGMTSSLPQDGVVIVTKVTTARVPNAPTVSPQSCMTGKRVAGSCVKRERCDHGTAAVDFTLYRPRGYKPSSCSGEDVCCPPQYLVQQDGRGAPPESEGFEFDDDD